jgi:hypothetical protein
MGGPRMHADAVLPRALRFSPLRAIAAALTRGFA